MGNPNGPGSKGGGPGLAPPNFGGGGARHLGPGFARFNQVAGGWNFDLRILLVVLFGVLAALLITWLILRMNHKNRTINPPANGLGTVLDERYARGEISREQYLQMRTDLLGPSVVPG